MTAGDVAFTLDQLRTGRLTDDPEVDYANIADVRVDGDRELTVTLKRPDAPSAWRFAPFLLPKHKLEAEADVFSSGFWSAPVGSGPYRFVSGVAGEEVRLQPRESDGTPLRAVFGRTADEQRERFDEVGDAVVWVDGPEAGAASESVVETPSAVWQAWLMNAAAGHETSDRGLRRTFAKCCRSTSPWIRRRPTRGATLCLSGSALSTAQATAALDAAGWRRSGSRDRGAPHEAELTLASPTLLAETDLFVVGVVDTLKDLGFRAGSSVTPSLGQGGLFDIDPLSTGSFDIARTTLALGAPYTVGWPFEPGDEPSIKNPDGSNVTRLEDSELAKAVAAVRASGDPAEAAAGMRRLGKLLQRTDTVLWDGQLPARLLTIGVNDVGAHPLPEYAVISAPDWSIDTATSGPDEHDVRCLTGSPHRGWPQR